VIQLVPLVFHLRHKIVSDVNANSRPDIQFRTDSLQSSAIDAIFVVSVTFLRVANVIARL